MGVKFFGAKLPITVNFFNFFTHHILSRHHQKWTNKYMNLPHVLVRDESTENDALKSQKNNCNGHSCPSFEIWWLVLLQKILRGHFCPFVTIMWVVLHFSPSKILYKNVLLQSCLFIILLVLYSSNPSISNVTNLSFYPHMLSYIF